MILCLVIRAIFSRKLLVVVRVFVFSHPDRNDWKGNSVKGRS